MAIICHVVDRLQADCLQIVGKSNVGNFEKNALCVYPMEGEVCRAKALNF